jgi:hypothetical protein
MLRCAVIVLVPTACAALVVAGLVTRLTAAAFTANTAVANGVTVDKLANHFSVAPGTDVQPGTGVRVASGDVDTLALAFGTVPSARTFSSVFTITNVSGTAQTAALTLTGVPQIASALFAKSGTTSVTLAAGESTTLVVATSSTVAGLASGTLRLALTGISWLYRDYAVAIAQAPEAPTGLSATARKAGRIQLQWSASSTTTNLAGYDVYRSSGSGWTKLNPAPLTGTGYDDVSTVDGTTYTYKIQAVSTDAAPLVSLDSSTATATADATPPAAPTAVALASAWINASNRSSASVSVTLPSGSLASDIVTVTLSDGSNAVSKSAPASGGAGTVTVSGLDASALADGSISLSATSTDLAGNESTAKSGSASKDTIAPSLGGISYSDGAGSGDRISGTTEAGAAVTITKAGGGSWSASGAAFNVQVANVRGAATTTVTYTITATDAAGNPTSVTQTWADTK